MEQTEVEKLIGELETALDRLRSLYEQYFVGIERIEPAVARKDVERRLYVLRREQIRNTALRYRFQMVLQKFNTYQTHWLRICREIENGTYKRHMIRAQRRFGSVRPGGRRRSSAPPSVHPPPGAPLPAELASQLAALDEDFAPPSFDVDVQLDDESPASAPPATQPSRVAPAAVPAPAPRPAGPVAPPVWKKVGAPVAPAPPARAPLGAPVPPARPPMVGPAAPAGSPQPPQRVPPLAGSIPARVPPPLAVPPARVPPPVASPPARIAPAATAVAAPPVAAPRAPHPVPPSVFPPRPPRPSPPGLGPPRPATIPPPRPPPDPSDLSEKRLRQIYVEYVDAKRRQNESTAAITYQAVAKSLRESGDKLRQKHGKPVDFEVMVKDGKTILKPVLKG